MSKKQFSGQRFLCSAHSLLIRLLRRSYAWHEKINMTVWPSGLRRWLQAPVRKGVGSNPTAVSSLQQRCAAVSPTTKLNQHFGQNVAHVVLSTSTQPNVKFKLPSTNRCQKNSFRVRDSYVLHIPFLSDCYDVHMLGMKK